MKYCVSCGAALDGEGWTCSGCGFGPTDLDGMPSFVGGAHAAPPAEFDERTFERMKALEGRSFYIRARRAVILWAVQRFFAAPGAYYDFGVGTGFQLAEAHALWPGAKLFGSDLSPDSLRFADRRNTGAALFHTDADHIPFRDHFDLISTLDVIEHIPDDVAALKALFAALKPGGGLLVTVPQHMVFWSVLDDKTGHQRRYVGNELARKTREAGFEVLMDTSFMASLFLPQYVSRRWMSQDPDAEFETEHNLPGPVNAVLSGILAMELASLKAGLRYPFGGMRLVAARRPA